MSKVIQRVDKQGEIVERREQIKEIIKEIEDGTEDLKIVAFMEHTTRNRKAKSNKVPTSNKTT